MTLNGKLLQFDNTIIEYDHKTFFPVRELANKLGATVDWDEQNQTILLEKEIVDAEDPSKEVPSDSESDNSSNKNMGYEIIDSSDITSKYPKYGFDNVYMVNGNEYIPIIQLEEVVHDKGLYLHPILDNGMLINLQLRENDQNGEVLIDNIPSAHIELYWSVDYAYYREEILPLVLK